MSCPLLSVVCQAAMAASDQEELEALGAVLSSALASAVSSAMAVAMSSEISDLLDHWQEIQNGSTEELVSTLTKLVLMRSRFVNHSVYWT